MNHTNFNIIANRRRWYLLSALFIIPGIVSLFVWGINVGIDFKGGTLQQISFGSKNPSIEQVRTSVEAAKATGATVQTTDNNQVIVRFPVADNTEARKTGDAILSELKKNYPDVKEESFESIGGSVASSTTTKAIWSVILTAIAISFFIAWSFAAVPRPASSWRFGLAAIAALLHDLLFVLGAFSLIGHFFPSIEVDALFITAMLTILGFSVNDTIVVFDRIRENLRRNPGHTFEDIANSSLNQTLARSLNTSMTVLIVLLALLVLGGSSIRNFILALTLGVAIGTYSSIFNASPILVTWQNFVDKRAAKPTTGKKK